jgi:hypothetical protein
MSNLKKSDRKDKLIALCQYAAFLKNLRTAAAVMVAKKGDFTLGVMTPFGEARLIKPGSPVPQIIAEVMFEVERLRDELGLEALTADDMATAEAFDAAVWRGVDSIMEGQNARSRYAQ